MEDSASMFASTLVVSSLVSGGAHAHCDKLFKKSTTYFSMILARLALPVSW